MISTNTLTVPEADLLGASDEAHLEQARIAGRVLLIQDDDFLRLHSAGVNHAGIAYAPQGASIGEIIRSLMMIHQVLEAEGMIGHIEYLCGPKKPGTSVRPLQGSLSVAGDPGREPPIGSSANMCGLGEVRPLKSRQ